MVQVDKRLFEAKSADLLDQHAFLKLFNRDTVKIILENSVILKVRTGQVLYKQNDPTY